MKKRYFLIFSLLVAIILAIGITTVGAFAAESNFASKSDSTKIINVWLIAGQSNAVGYGEGAPEAAELDSRYTDGFDNVIYYGSRWGDVTSDFMPTAVGMGKGEIYCGAELGIASALGNSGTMHAIIKYAVGGTSLYPITSGRTWTSDSYIADVNKDSDPSNDVDTSVTTIGKLYDNFMNTVENGLRLLIEDGYTPVIKGLLWSQGGAESLYNDRSLEYEKLLRHLVNDMRKDLSEIANDPSINDSDSPMPFVIVKTYRNPDNETAQTIVNIPIINAAQSTIASEMKNVSVVDPSTEYKFHQLDAWHYSTESQISVGEMFTSDVYGKESKYLVTYNGEYALVDIGFHSEGERVTSKFTIDKRYSAQSITMQIGDCAPTPITLDKDGSYTFTMPADTVTFHIETVPIGATETVTPYGTIPKKYFVAENYPIVIFRNGNFIDVAKSFNTDASKKAAAAGDGAVILLRTDYDASAERSGTNLLSTLNGSVTYDLGGYTVSMGEGGSRDALIKCDAYALGYQTNVTVKNGTILAGDKGIVRFSAAEDRASAEYLAGYESDPHKFTVTFEGVGIGLDPRVADYGKIVVDSYKNISSVGKNISSCKIVMKECTLDLRGSSDSFIIFYQNNINVSCEVIGGKIIADSFDGITFNKSTALTVKKDSSEKYVTLSLSEPYSSGSVFTSDTGEALSFVCTHTENGRNIYSLINASLNTPYGPIDKKYLSTSDYPWLIYKDGVCIGGGKDFTKAVFSEAVSAIDGKSKITIYLRCDVTDGDFTSAASAQSKFSGTVTVDLGGHKVSMSEKNYPLIRCEVVGKGYDTRIVLKNGTVLVGKQPIVRFALTSSLYEGYEADSKTDPHKFNILIENLLIKRDPAVTEEFTTRIVCYSGSNYESSGTVGRDNTVTVKDCTFDFESTEDAFTLFSSYSVFGIDVNLIGGVIKAPNLTNTSSGIRISTFAAGGGVIKVGKGGTNEYTKLILPTEKSAPATKYADIESSDSASQAKNLVFFKVGEENGKHTYKLIPEEILPSDFNPKTSVSIYSDLSLNIYVPKSAYISSLLLNGEEIFPSELKEDGEYYVISKMLSAKEAAKVFDLEATLTSRGVSLKGSYSFSIPSYAKTVIEDSENSLHATLAKGMLHYIRCSYEYFEVDNSAESIEFIDTVLGGYAPDFSKSDARDTSCDGLKAVTFILNSMPTVRFYVSEGFDKNNFVFFIGSEAVTDLSYSCARYKGKKYDCIDITVPAYMITEGISYTYGTSGDGYYHANSYYDYITSADFTSEKKGELIELFEAFYLYAESAKNYKNSILQ